MSNLNHKFTDKMFTQILAPTVIAAVGLGLANIADSLAVGINIGEEGVAAVGITLPVYMIFALFYVGIGVGGSVEYARLMGAGEKEKALDIFNIMMGLSIFVSLLFVLAGDFFMSQVMRLLGVSPDAGLVYDYSYGYARMLLCLAPVFFLNTPLHMFIRSDDNPKLASFGFLVGNVLDVGLNFVFVYYFGVIGAVLSTIVGQTVSIIIYLPHLINRRSNLKIRKVKIDFRLMLLCFKKGFASSNQYISQFVFIALSNHILLEKSGHVGVAVFDIVMNVSYIAMSLYQASGDTILPLASTFHGENNPIAKRRVLSDAMWFGMISGTLVVILIAVFAGPICNVFGLESDLQMGISAVRIYCIGALFAGFSTILSSYYQSIERDNFTLCIFLLRGTIFLIGFTVWFAFLNVACFWLVFPLTEIASVVVYLIFRKIGFIYGKQEEYTKDRVLSLFFDTDNYDLSSAVEKTEMFCERFDASIKQIHYVTMTIEELCGAIIQNAFGSSHGKEQYIQITVVAEKEGIFRLCIRDNAEQFNPFEMKMKKASLEDEEDDFMKGLGVMMVKSKAKEFYYRRYQKFNMLIVKV